jgi:hypothetical protein
VGTIIDIFGKYSLLTLKPHDFIAFLFIETKWKPAIPSVRKPRTSHAKRTGKMSNTPLEITHT